MTEPRLIFSRCAADSFETHVISSIIQKHGCDVFSIFVGLLKDAPYEIWAKYDSSCQLIEIDLEIARFWHHHPRRRRSQVS